LGEASARKQAHKAILQAHPWCIYCGGLEPATTIEHMPPIGIFWGRQRPKGLEFPSCKFCNTGTRLSDLVASTVARTFPEPSTVAQRDEVKKLLAAVGNNVPGLIEEMQVGRAGQKLAARDAPIPEGGGVLRADGPLVTKHLQIFAAKMGFALHFEAAGFPVPPEGGVQVMWFSNMQAIKGQIPESLLELLPSPRTLRQGTVNVSDQFQYSWAGPEEKGHRLFYAVFRQSFSIAAVSALDRSILLGKHSDKFRVVVPGELRNSSKLPKGARDGP
jgi:hypothetical protein